MDKITYKDSGVDIDVQDEGLKKVKKLIRGTFNKNVLTDIGLFGGLYRFDKNSILVASADGVGTKIKVAIMAKKFDTIGEDLVNHCVNDILAQGAKPLFFVDYFATGKLNSKIFVEVIKGIVKGCKKNNLSLIGGETAEMPDLYSEGDFDLAGFIVGVVNKKDLLPRKITEGDILIGLPSNGLHTNGYSLVRKLFFEKLKLKIDYEVEELKGTVKDVLLKVHKSYLNSISKILKFKELKGIAHITGGGIRDNLPRILGKGLCAEIYKNSWEIPKLFRFIQEKGNIEEEEMFRVFNMGVGLILAVKRGSEDKIMEMIKEEKPFIIGKIKKGASRIHFV